MRRLAVRIVSALILLFVATLPAQAQENDVIERLDIVYTVAADGSIEVTETIEWNFQEEGARGIVWDIVTAERWDQDRDYMRHYDVTDIRVTGIDGERIETEKESFEGDDYHVEELKIGDGKSLETTTMTYIVSYTIDGLIATHDGRPEIFEDINSEALPPVKLATVTVTAPGRVVEARCLLGDGDCESKPGDPATYSATDLSPDKLMSVVAVFNKDHVTPREPDTRLVMDNSYFWWLMRWTGVTILGVWALIATLPRLLWARDNRWVGVAPAVMAPEAAVRKGRRLGEVPVRFEPPEAPIEEVALALDREFKPRHLAAIMVAMAAKGALEVQSKPLNRIKGDESKVKGKWEAEVFRWSMDSPAESLPSNWNAGLVKRLRRFARQDAGKVLAPLEWSRRIASWGLALVPLLIAAAVCWWLWDGTLESLYPAFAILVGLMIAMSFSSNIAKTFKVDTLPLARNPRGTALVEQLEGFETYLTTAESRQLEFEADRDIYRRYLPWAVLLGQTKRWTQACKQLAAQGKIDPVDQTLGFTSERELSKALREMEREYKQAYKESKKTPSSSSSGSSRSSDSGSGGSSGLSDDATGGSGTRGRSGSSW